MVCVQNYYQDQQIFKLCPDQWFDNYACPLTGQFYAFITTNTEYIDSLMQDCSNSIANTLELLQSYTK